MPSIALPVSLRGQLLSGSRFSPLSLFTASEPGLWYDPSDLTTMFEDTAGTIPVTTPGQSVARINDKSGRGNNATQSTAASRPTYGVHPITGVRNQFTFTEQFENGVWSKTSTTIASNVAVAPDQTSTADKLQENSGAAGFFSVGRNPPAAFSTAYTWSCYAKRVERQFMTVNFSALGVLASIDLATGETRLNMGSATLQATDALNGWWRFSLTFNTAASGANLLFHVVTTSLSLEGAPITTGIAGHGFLLWGAQLQIGALSQYQRVTTSFDVTEAGVPSVSYLSFDGVDDFLVTPTVTPGIDKVQVFAGLRKLSDAVGYGILAETGGGSGTFTIHVPYDQNTGSLDFTSRGTSGASATVTTGYAAPLTTVMSGLGDISGDRATLRLNSNQVAQNTGDQGTGNYLANAIFIGRRAGTSLPFNGNIYQLIVRFGANLDAGTISSAETFVNEKTGAY